MLGKQRWPISISIVYIIWSHYLCMALYLWKYDAKPVQGTFIWLYIDIDINELNHLNWRLSRSLPHTNRSRSTWRPQAWAASLVWPLPCLDDHRRHLFTSMSTRDICLISTHSRRPISLCSPEAGPFLLPFHQIALHRNKLVVHWTMVLTRNCSK